MAKSSGSEWPNDDDGDVFRSLQSQGFDFSKPYQIDFNIDLTMKNESQVIVMAIRRKFPEANIYIEDFEEPVYIRVAVNHLVEYEYVIVMQQALTDLSSPWLGICESWGVLH